MGLGVVLMTALVTAAKADERVIRQHTFDLGDIKEVEFTNSVGSIDIVPADGDQIRIVLDIEGQHHGFFRRTVDVDNMDLEVRERGNVLFLTFDEKDASAEWTVEIPVVEHIRIEMGVGELRLETGATDLHVELGVGDVVVDAPAASIGRINVDVGVGDADVRGADILDRDKAFISQSIRAQGDGSHDIDIEVGVGDVDVRLD